MTFKKKLTYSFLVLVAGLLIVTNHGRSQGVATTAVPTQQTATHADAAVVSGSSATSAATITFAAQGNLYFYLTELDVQNCASGSAVTAAAPTNLSVSNITGSPIWTIGSGATAGLCTQNFTVEWPTGLKSAVPGTAVTFTLPTFATNQTVRVNVVGFYGY